MSQNLRNKGMLKLACCAAVLVFYSVAGQCQSTGKVHRDVIDFTAANGSALVLVGLDLPWEMESRLSQEKLRAQRTTIASIQNELLDKLAGRKFTVVRRYQEVPGIALDVGADALAELARLPIVTSVSLDRAALPIQPKIDHEIAPGTAIGILSSEKVPFSLFTRAARDGTVLVLAGLRTPWQREDLLTDKLVDLQRNAIHGVQSYLLGELAGTHYKVMRLYGKIPGIALRVGVDALIILERSPAITNVLPDRAAQLMR
jgi:hypothetical protein